jgi:hypothetical protein
VFQAQAQTQADRVMNSNFLPHCVSAPSAEKPSGAASVSHQAFKSQGPANLSFVTPPSYPYYLSTLFCATNCARLAALNKEYFLIVTTSARCPRAADILPESVDDYKPVTYLPLPFFYLNHHHDHVGRPVSTRTWLQEYAFTWGSGHESANGQIGPFSREVTETLRLGNPHSTPVAFKVCPSHHTHSVYCTNYKVPQVKTTAPKQYVSSISPSHIPLKPSRYCVRPNSGLIQPNGTVDVQGKILTKSKVLTLIISQFSCKL